MHKLVEVIEGVISDNDIQFIIEAAEPFVGVEAAGQMIADADNNAFIYKVDTGTSYIYVQFGMPTWPALSKALLRQDVPLLVWGQQILPLANFHEELWGLLENIIDNGNCGTTYRRAISEIFHEALASRA